MLTIILASFAGCAATLRLPAAGTVAGQRVETTVDSEAAHYYLDHHLDRTDDKVSQKIEVALRKAGADPYDRESLERLSEGLSVDLAALYFAADLYARPANGRAQDAFHATLKDLENPGTSEVIPEAWRSYLIAFVPGYGYRKNPENGADFSRQRKIMTDRGFQTTLIKTAELGTVEENAGIVADALRRFAAQGQKVLLVSTSRGGPEVALALGNRLSPEATNHVKAWISVGGLLRGSPYADYNLRWPRRWVVNAMLKLNDHHPDTLRTMSTTVRRPAFDQIRLPHHLFTVQYVAVPLSGHIEEAVHRRYDILSANGPNDGLTLLADELVPGGVVVTDIGLDHYYRDPIIGLKTVALAYVVLRALEGQEAHSACSYPRHFTCVP
jgi:hypothetical protein